jgi:hypothetical protein
MKTVFVTAFMAGDCSRFEARQRIFPPWRFPGGYRETLLPVRKSLTKKSGIIGLPAFVGQGSLVYGERG